MKLSRTIVVTAVLLAPFAGQAQPVVRQEKFGPLPTPVLLETTGLFQDRYAKVGDDLFIGGQPTERALRELKAQGVTTIINLRMPVEMRRIGFDEEKLIRELGMSYVYIPMRGATTDSGYTPANLAKFAEAMQSAPGKVLLHCTIAWRASHIWAAYLITRGVPDEVAVKHARSINLMDNHRMDDSGKQPLEMFLGRPVAGLGKP